MSVGLDIHKDGKTTVFTLNRPEKKNTISAGVATALREGFEEFDASDQKVAIIAGAGKHFSGGADLDDLPILWKALPTLGLATEKPVICAINGLCVGGAFVMAAMCDLCVAAETARFHYPEAQFGVAGGYIATLATRIAHKHVMEIILLGREIPAQRAYEMGLVNQVVPHGQQLDAALAIARELEPMAPLVHKMLKRFITEDVLTHSPSELMARTQRNLEMVTTSYDRAEGIAAFKEGRPGVFLGR
jgi:enoyl-CoA hydratase/carnithine racemase